MRATERNYKQAALAVLLTLKREYEACATLEDVINENETKLLD